MPQSAPTPCRYPGCPALIHERGSYCTAHQGERRAGNDGASARRRQASRGALATNLALWRKIRERILRGEPLCRACALVERLTPATCVDHIDNDPFNIGDDNLQPLCKPCHSRKTMRDLRSQRRDPFAVKPQKKANALPNDYIF